MKKPMNKLTALLKNTPPLLAALLATSAISAAEEKPGDITTVSDGSYMLVRHFDTVEKNDAFQRNLGIMQRDARAISIIKARLEGIADEAEKADLEAKLKQLEDAFKSNDAVMQKAYGFASNRTYKFVFLESNISVPLTNEELSSLKSASGEDLDLMKISEKNGTSLYSQTNVKGTAENDELRRMIGFTIARRNDIAQIRKDISQTTDPEEQLALTAKLSAAEKALRESEENLRVKYNIQEGRDYVVEVKDSKLYLLLTPEELLKIQLERESKK